MKTEALEILRNEHEEIARFLTTFEEALTLAEGPEDEDRATGLTRLRSLVAENARLREDCRQDAESLHSSLFLLGDDTQWKLWRQSLFRLGQASFDFRKELGFATTLSTEDVVARGRRLVTCFRDHMSYEEALF